MSWEVLRKACFLKQRILNDEEDNHFNYTNNCNLEACNLGLPEFEGFCDRCSANSSVYWHIVSRKTICHSCFEKRSNNFGKKQQKGLIDSESSSDSDDEEQIIVIAPLEGTLEISKPQPTKKRVPAPPIIDPTTGEIIKRKRGRPKRVHVDEDAQAYIPTNVPPKIDPITGLPIKRKRGRPKKQPKDNEDGEYVEGENKVKINRKRKREEEKENEDGDGSKTKTITGGVCNICFGLKKKRKDIIVCHKCERSFHPLCFNPPLKFRKCSKYDWCCSDCKVCTSCDSGQNESQILCCDNCDRGYHMTCLDPVLTEVPDGIWHCPKCSTKHGKRAGRPKRLVDRRNDSKGWKLLCMDDEPTLERHSLLYVPPKGEELVRNEVCFGCGLKGSKTTLLGCDRCNLVWHRYCLAPPMDKDTRSKMQKDPLGHVFACCAACTQELDEIIIHEKM